MPEKEIQLFYKSIAFRICKHGYTVLHIKKNEKEGYVYTVGLNYGTNKEKFGYELLISYSNEVIHSGTDFSKLIQDILDYIEKENITFINFDQTYNYDKSYSCKFKEPKFDSEQKFVVVTDNSDEDYIRLNTVSKDHSIVEVEIIPN